MHDVKFMLELNAPHSPDLAPCIFFQFTCTLTKTYIVYKSRRYKSRQANGSASASEENLNHRSGAHLRNGHRDCDNV